MSEGVAAAGTPGGAAVQKAPPRRAGSRRAGVLDQGLGDGRVADRAVESLGTEQGVRAAQWPMAKRRLRRKGGRHEPRPACCKRVSRMIRPLAFSASRNAWRTPKTVAGSTTPCRAVELHSSGLAHGAETQADGEASVLAPLLLDDRPQLLRAEGISTLTGPLLDLPLTVSRYGGCFNF